MNSTDAANQAVGSTAISRLSRDAALRFVILLGVVSLFADMTYEGARSINGPFLAVLGASGTVVGIVAGVGELLGYGLRLFSGYVSDKTQRYWPVAILGYVVNLGAVPLLAFAGRWEAAAALMIAERIGKAIRNPARDTMLSHATVEMGRGWGFGMHESLDQAGAMIGPLVVAAALAREHGFGPSYAILAIPAALAVIILLGARRLYPEPRDFEPASLDLTGEGLPRVFWRYLGTVALVAAAYADFPLIAFHFQRAATVATDAIPIFYAVAMGISALTALGFGRLFDRIGLPALAATTLLAAPFAPLVFFGGSTAALVGMGLWGVGMGAQDSIMRAAVAGMVPPDRRGATYGLFDTGYGVAWFVGSVVMGILYDRSIPALVVFSVVLQLAAVPLLIGLRNRVRR